ncbi:MAG: SLBB domain-containing protein [Desulfobacterales bacterium]|jgi:NADH:ubiquinone oxidoreductase subunit F (NADH-binding)/(2Fe-2S) ferredoxin|nr:SLBB domain-containing protein [Desulfobacterales bacterium]
MKIKNMKDLDKVKEIGMKSLFPKGPQIRISMSTCGLALGADDLFQKITREKDKKGIKISLHQTGCSGFCNLEPMAIVKLPGKPALLYTQVTVENVEQIIRDIKKKKIPQKGLFCMIGSDSAAAKPDPVLNAVPDYRDASPFKGQHRMLLGNCGIIDPLSVSEYVAMAGYSGLFKALYQMRPEEVIKEVVESGLRGRGGAWFPTGFKWDMASKSSGDEKFVICNADEGDPGAYKDRTIMEGNPFKLFEGIVLAGYAIGSHHGIIYLREEYHHTFGFLSNAIEIAKRFGLLGKNILGSGFNFALNIVRGGGSYVCGEETALMDSLEGEVGDPRLRPPFPIEKGLWARPTIVNNVETLSNVPLIIQNGGKWYKNIGTEKAKGTKILSVIGNVKHPGLYEIPLGTNLKQVIFEMAGGPVNGKSIKAVQVGSPFGTFIPADKLNVSLDPESLREIGSMIGSGVIVALDQDACIVDILHHLLTFFVEESCGKCVPCREGVSRMEELMIEIYNGRAGMNELDIINELGETARDFSLCALGGGAPAPILNGIKDFKKDFEAHIKTGKCLRFS